MNTLKLSELEGLTKEQIGEKLDNLFPVNFNHSNGNLSLLREKIARRESTYGFPSNEMLKRISNGSLVETLEIIDWVFDYAELQEMLEWVNTVKH